MSINFKEQWIVAIDRKEFVVSKEEREKIISAMKEGKRYVLLDNGTVLSVRRISYLYLHSKEITNQLPEGEKYANALPPDEMTKRIAEIKQMHRI
jgi:hypothetical protein